MNSVGTVFCTVCTDANEHLRDCDRDEHSTVECRKTNQRNGGRAAANTGQRAGRLFTCASLVYVRCCSWDFRFAGVLPRENFEILDGHCWFLSHKSNGAGARAKD